MRNGTDTLADALVKVSGVRLNNSHNPEYGTFVKLDGEQARVDEPPGKPAKKGDR